MGGSGELGKNEHAILDQDIHINDQHFCRADKANEVYPDLKPITRCHSYAIQYKYNYKCTTCDFM